MSFFFTPANIRPHRQFKSGDRILTVSDIHIGSKYRLFDNEISVEGTKLELASYLSEHKFEPFNFTRRKDNGHDATEA